MQVALANVAVDIFDWLIREATSQRGLLVLVVVGGIVAIFMLRR
jgi:hypothetical protein